MREEKQELFDRALAHIRQQGGPSFCLDEHRCKYRIDGRMCAAGIFIKDYTPRIEVGNWAMAVLAYRDRLELLAVKHVDFVCLLQREHDEPAWRTDSDQEFMLEFERRMRALARLNNLTYWEADDDRNRMGWRNDRG